MAGRIRTIKPSFFLNEDLATLDPIDRLAFIGLWNYADKAGRLEDRPIRLKAQIQPYDKGDFNATLERLASHNFIVRYQVNGLRLIQVTAFQKHQRPHHTEAESELPEPNGCLTVTSPLDDREAPDGREGNGKEGKGMEPPIVPHKRGTTEHGFSEWWKTYPKKVGRGPALEAWKKLTPEERALALEAAKRFAEAWDGAPEENRRFQVGPAPFLNQKRWEDDPAEWLRIAFRDAPEALKRRQKEAGDLEHRRRMERILGAAEKETES